MLQLIEILSVLLSSAMIMILHELPKSIVYNLWNRNQSKKSRCNIYKIWNYIDPIGMICCLTTYAGFSKPYMFRIKEKRTNFALGITGFLSLSFIFGFSIILLKYVVPPQQTAVQVYNISFFLSSFLYMTAILSINMLIVNLFPVSTFDCGLLIAGKSPSKYFSIIKGDFIIKLILLFALGMQLIARLGISFTNLLLL